ncbi:MAG: 16S rRNA (guanine(527)-N(7))-methyltransferase RsmG [Mycobacteriales bacterium]
MSLSASVGAAAPLHPPPAARALFGSRLSLVEQFVSLLCGPGVARGLLGPREAERIWDRHILNCAVLADLLPPASRVVDLGSGAGLPGIVLALARPDVSMCLVEPMQRRVDFLTECLEALELHAVTVRRARAEELTGQAPVDVVTARAVAQLPRLLPLAMPLLVPDGLLLAIKGASAPEELAASADVLRSSGGYDAQVVLCGQGLLDMPTTVVSVRRVAAATTGGRRP